MHPTTLIALLSAFAAVQAGYFSLSTHNGVEISPLTSVPGAPEDVSSSHAYGQWSSADVPVVSGPFSVRNGGEFLQWPPILKVVANSQCSLGGKPGVDKYYNYHVEFGFNAAENTLTMSKCGCFGNADSAG
jgi:hypothetical protein